ncbi:MAG: mandelate racemase/muconate lactonizing enzyme family protein [Bryobacterales bacterium]|nr:mandelate racemase/muconate lactonizing enzyme family protein [Acidobacteriota bacterium]MCB9385431.1 mandelate racemase/muconate lactonizing enzyme family protein [Bryobacterales bacterium]
MTVSVVAIVSDVERDGKPLVGYGFNSNGRYDQQGLLSRRFIPRLMDADPKSLLDDECDNFDPHKAWKTMMADEKPGGHGERSVAVGVLDMALWDLVAKIEGKPLYQLLADRYRAGEADESVWVYAAGGYYYPGKDIPQLVAEMQRYVAMGYEAVKIKIGGAPLDEDLKRIEAVLEAIGPGRRLAVDANGRFDRATALAYAEALSAYPLLWYEEAGDPLDYALNAEVAAASKVPVATGENLFSMQDARNLLRHGGMLRERDWLQMDPALSYGLVEYLRTLGALEAQGWSPRRCVPHGGHQFALHLAAGLGLGGNESYPGVFEPFGGFADGVPVENGRVKLPDAPGIGIEAKQSLRGVYERLLG